MYGPRAAEWGAFAVKIQINRGFWKSVWGLSILGVVATSAT
jgi:hypothetical protein